MAQQTITAKEQARRDSLIRKACQQMFAQMDRENGKRMEAVEREQRRQAEIIARHDAAISELQHKVEQIEKNLNFIDDRIAKLDALLDFTLQQQEGTVEGGKEWMKLQRSIMATEKQIHTEEQRRDKLMWDRKTARAKMPS